MSNWVEEIVRHIIQKGKTKIFTQHNLLLGVIDSTTIKEGQEEIDHTDQTNVIRLSRYITNDDRFKAYLGIRHLLVREGKYYTSTIMIIFDISSSSYALIEIDNDRQLQRFRNKMFNGMKILVFKALYSHFYMTDIDYQEEFSE